MEIPLTPAALLRAFEAPAAALSNLPRVVADLAASVESLAHAGRHADDVAEDLAAIVEQSRALLEDASGPAAQLVQSASVAAEELPPEKAREVAQAVAGMPEATARFNEQGERMNGILEKTEQRLDRVGPLIDAVVDRIDEQALQRLAGIATAERVDQLVALLDAAPAQVQRVPALLDAADSVLPRVPELLQTLDTVLPRLPALLDAADGALPRLPALLDAADGALPRLPALLDAADELLPRLPALLDAVDGLLPRLPALVDAVDELLPRLPALLDAVDRLLPRLDPLLDTVEGRVFADDGLLGLPDKMDPMARNTDALREDVSVMRELVQEMMPQLNAMGQVIEGMPGASFAKRRAQDEDDTDDDA